MFYSNSWKGAFSKCLQNNELLVTVNILIIVGNQTGRELNNNFERHYFCVKDKPFTAC